MDEHYLVVVANMQKAQTIAELRECNDLTLPYGLFLSEQQIQTLAQRRFAALKDTGRVEFGQGILKKLVAQFCDSPYLTKKNYEDTILELQDSFYYFKNESMDLISDDELIEYMKKVFDGKAQGSLDYLNGISLEDLCRTARYGYESDEGDEGDDTDI